jgi:hypothetical protein
MDNLRRITLLALGILFLGAASTQGGEYRDSTGFSFTYPDDWFAVANPSKVLGETALSPELQRWMTWVKESNIDLSKTTVWLGRTGAETVTESINVVVDHKQIPVSENTLKSVLKAFPEVFQAKGAPMENLKGRIQKVGVHDALVLEYGTRLPVESDPVRIKQVMFSGGGNTYYVTCSATPDAFPRNAQTFDTVLASVKVPEPLVKEPSWMQSWSFIIVCGCFGMLFYAGKRLLGIKDPRESSRKTEPDSRAGG